MEWHVSANEGGRGKWREVIMPNDVEPILAMMILAIRHQLAFRPSFDHIKGCYLARKCYAVLQQREWSSLIVVLIGRLARIGPHRPHGY